MKFLNALFVRFLRLSLRAVFAKTAWQSINLALFLLFGLPRSLCSLAMTAKLCHFERSDPTGCKAQAAAKKSKEIWGTLWIYGYFAALSMTNSGFCLKIMDIFTQILKHKFKFFTQNSRLFTNSTHLINSEHFINLSQISSHTQGFFIFLPQIFAQFLLINSTQRSSYGRQGTKAPF